MKVMAYTAFRSEHELREDLYDRILLVLPKMPEELREVFILSHYEGRSIERVAEALGIPVEQVEFLLEEANTLFREMISPPSEKRIEIYCGAGACS